VRGRNEARGAAAIEDIEQEGGTTRFAAANLGKPTGIERLAADAGGEAWCWRRLSWRRDCTAWPLVMPQTVAAYTGRAETTRVLPPTEGPVRVRAPPELAECRRLPCRFYQ